MKSNYKKPSFISTLRTEDYTATFLGAILLTLVIIFPQFFGGNILGECSSSNEFIKLLHKNIGENLVLFFVIGILTYVSFTFMKDNTKRFLLSFITIFALAVLARFIGSISQIKALGFEAVFFAVSIGLIIRNVFGLPSWLSPAVRSEFYIKTGLVILGSSILFNEILVVGKFGMLQAIIVVLCVWYFTFWLAKKLKIDKEMSIMLSSAVSICGVSAAIASCGAIKGDSKKLSFVVSIVLIFAIPMMYLMPYIAQWIGLSPQVAGAWLGGTIDTTAAVVASGEFLGPEAEKYSVIIKSAQNALLGIAAFAISIYWSFKGTNESIRPSGKVLWERFPKFVVGFIIASLVFSFMLEPETAKVISKVANKGMRTILFALAFVCIGLETDFRYIFKKENNKLIWTFTIAQLFNIFLTLIVAYVLFEML